MEKTSTFTSPELVKRLEKEIVQEAKREEKDVKKVLSDYKHVEKVEIKGHKEAAKAASTLEKREKKEQEALKDVYRAEHKHGVAVTDLQKAEHDFEQLQLRERKLKEAKQLKEAQLEQTLKEHEQHTQARNTKLNALRGPSREDEAARVIGDPADANL